MKKIILLISCLWMISCSNKEINLNTFNEQERWEYRANNIQIIRDDFGIPHIYGKTDADAVFGMLYAQCEDDFNRVEQNYIWATGRLAEIEGEKALYSDLRANLFMTQEEAIAAYEKSPKWLQDLCVAFADGINYYLKNHPEVKPKLLTHFEPWMPMFFSEGSIGGDIERVSTSKIRDFYEPQNSDKKLAILEGYIHQKDDEPRGSNGFAIAGNKTASGNAMLLINPHTSFFFRGESHVVSEEGLNAYGATTWGQFFIYQGFNEKTGWMHTSTGTDIIDEFAETIVKKKSGIHYQYGEELRKVDSLTITLQYKSDEELSSKDFTIYRTHHGPITHKEEGKWIATALMWNPVKALEQSFTRTKKSTYDEFHKMMDIKTNSSNNTVYADADGTIAYYHGNFIPKRNTKFDYSKPVDGSNPQTDWHGLHELKDHITLKNPPNGWIQNCNSTPFTSAGENSPKKENYPYYMATFPENFRGIHAIPLLEKAADLTLDDLIELAYDPYLPGAKMLTLGLVKAYSKNPSKYSDLKKPIEFLKNWNFHVSRKSFQMTLIQFYLYAYEKSGKIPKIEGNKRLNRLQQFDYMSNKSPYEERIAIFRQAIANVNSDFGTWKTTWGEFNRYQRLNGDIKQQFDDDKPSIPIGMASGKWGALASFGTKFGNQKKRQYGTSGNSFVAVVEFGDVVKAKSILAGGQNGNPNSPHFDDQAIPYAKAKFKDVAYYKEEVLARAKKIYSPGEEN